MDGCWRWIWRWDGYDDGVALWVYGAGDVVMTVEDELCDMVSMNDWRSFSACLDRGQWALDGVERRA